MKIKLLISRAGASFVNGVGDEITVSDSEAIRMIEAGQAVPAPESRKETTAKKTTAQRAVKD